LGLHEVARKDQEQVELGDPQGLQIWEAEAHPSGRVRFALTKIWDWQVLVRCAGRTELVVAIV
jgi:hypothetical protein